jgi:hypothetical protein
MIVAIITLFALFIGQVIKMGKRMVNKPRLVVAHSMPSVSASLRVKKNK